VQRLVAFLALQDRPLRRTYVSGRLWLDKTQDQAFGALRTTLWRLRRLPAPVVQATTTHLSLAPSVSVDARDFTVAAERFLRRRDCLDEDDVNRLAHASELLPDWYDEWVTQERDRIGQLRLLALESACEELVAAARYREAATAALAAVASDPLRESARRLLISTYLGTGNNAEALRQYVDFRTRLERELGLEPSFRMLELARSFSR
jgi:DNA-binding SARP family transcriptional activator